MNPAAEVREALVVATAEYVDPKLRRLRAPAADAERLAAVLSNPAIGRFAVNVALNAEERDLRRQLAGFFRNRRPDDLLFLHLSCHGVKDAHGDLYLAAADTELDLLSATAIPAAWLNEQLSRTRSRRTVVLLDCCFSGSFPFGARARVGGDVSMPDQFAGEGRGLAVVTASSAMEYAYEGNNLSGEGQPSYFTEAVVEALESGKADRDQDHLISVQELYDYVYERVKEKTPSQTPNMKSELQGPLYLARSSYRAPVTPAKLDDHLVALAEHRYAGAREGAVQELEALLGASDPGTALAARHLLERMVEDDSRRVSDRAKAALSRAPTLDGEPGDRPPAVTSEPPRTSEVERPAAREAPDSRPAERSGRRTPPSSPTRSAATAVASAPKAPARAKGRNRMLALLGTIALVAVVSALAVTTNTGEGPRRFGDCGGAVNDFQSGRNVEMRALADMTGYGYRIKDAGEPCGFALNVQNPERGPLAALLFDDLGSVREFDDLPGGTVQLPEAEGGGRTLDLFDVGGGHRYTSVSLPRNFRSYRYFGIAQLETREAGAPPGRLVLYGPVARLREPNS